MRHAPDCEHCHFVCRLPDEADAYLCSDGMRHYNLRCFEPCDWFVRSTSGDMGFRHGSSLDYLQENKQHLYPQELSIYHRVLCEGVRLGILSKTRVDQVFGEGKS